MTFLENPILLARQIADLHRAVSNWQFRLRSGDIDPTGPFIGTPSITERDAFRLIRDSNEPLPLQRAWLRWAFRLTEARVNAPLLATMAQAYCVDRHQLERPEPIEISLREVHKRMLTRPAERQLWANTIADHGATLQALSLEHLRRRDEIARRAGFADADAVTHPAHDLARAAEGLLAATDDVYHELVPQRLDVWLDTALALPAEVGWPAQLNSRSVQTLLGESSWTDGLELQPRAMPLPLAASSFARALYQLGGAIVEAAAPRHEPFVVAQDPYGLYRHALGALLAGLTASSRWQRDVLGLSRDRAREQARALGKSQLIHLRTAALSLSVAAYARAGSGKLHQDFAELSHRALGFTLPGGLAGLLPRLRVEIGQRLLGPCLASRWNEALVAEFDEDWFRNPHGVEAVRERLSRALPTTVESEELSASIGSYAASIHAWV